MTGLFERLRMWRSRRAWMFATEFHFRKMTLEMQKLQLQDFKAAMKRDKERYKQLKLIVERKEKDKYVV